MSTVPDLDTDCDLASARVKPEKPSRRTLTAEERHKQDWLDSWLEDYIYGDVVISGTEDLSVLAEAAWKKHCEDGPTEMDNRDLGVWDLARCDGGIR